MNKVFVVGSLNIDLVFTLDKIPQLGETLISSNFEITEGGKGNNQAIAVAKQDVLVYMVGNVGNDDFGRQISVQLETNKVQTKFMKQINNASTGLASIYVFNGDNQIVLNPGTNSCITKEQIDEAFEISSPGDIVVCQLEIPLSLVEYTLKQAKHKKLITILNPAPAYQLPKSMLSNVDYLIPNEIEAQMISQENDCFSAIAKMRHLGVKNVIITLGEKGLTYDLNGKQGSIPAIKVDVVDTTAAGDTLVGVFASYLARGLDEITGLKMSVVASGLTVTKKGAQKSIPTAQEVSNFIGKRAIK